MVTNGGFKTAASSDIGGIKNAGAPVDGVDAVQHLDSGGTGGSFKLSFTNPLTGETLTTAAIAWNATKAAVQAALLLLANMPASGVAATGAATVNAGQVILTFGGVLSGLAIPLLVVDNALLTGAVAQVETATIIETVPGTIGAGNVSIVVTAAGMTGSPKTILVAVAENDTADQVAGKVRTALALDAAVIALFDVSGATDKVILTRKTPAANDATLNIASADGTSSGLASTASSANTTAGVGPVVATTGTAGVPGTGRGAAKGSLLVDSDTPALYQNAGTAHKPDWALVGLQS